MPYDDGFIRYFPKYTRQQKKNDDPIIPKIAFIVSSSSNSSNK